MNINVSMTKNCAFCKYWYDPTNSAIDPIAPHQNMWRYEDRAERKCLKTNANKPAFATCDKFINKIL